MKPRKTILFCLFLLLANVHLLANKDLTFLQIHTTNIGESDLLKLQLLIPQAILLGIFLSILFYHLVMYGFRRDKILLYYSLYTLWLTLLLYINEKNTLFTAYAQNWNSIVKAFIELITGAFTVISYLLFFIHFVDRSLQNWKERKYLIVAVYLFVGDLILSCFQLYFEFYFGWIGVSYFLLYFRQVLFWIASMGIIYFLITWLKYNDRLIRTLVMSSMLLLIGGILFAVSDIGVYLFNDPVNNYIVFQIIALFQLMTYAVLLSYQIRRIEENETYLSALNEAKSRFFEDIAHEFRTPLNLINAPVEELIETTKTATELQKLAFIQRSTKRLSHLIQQILDLSKLEVGSLPVHLDTIELISFLQQILEEMKVVASQKKIEISLNSKKESIFIQTDRNHLEKIILNLVSNAIKFSNAEDTIEVTVSIVESDEELKIEVLDNGIGIDSHKQKYIFNRFYQVLEEKRTQHWPSSGIGLALTKELVALLKGEISVESELGKGSTFSVFLPYEKRVASSKAIQKEDTDQDLLQLSSNSQQLTERQQLLIVEDDNEIAIYIQSILVTDFQVFLASNGKEGLILATEKVPDLIIADVMMPQMDGFTLTQQLKNQDATSHIPIILLTGKTALDNKLKGLQLDADDYITKPFSPTMLKSRINNLLRNRQRLKQSYKHYSIQNIAPQAIDSKETIFLKKVTSVISQNFTNEHFSVEQLAITMNLNRSQLFRKLKALTDKSPSRFIRSYRLYEAKQLLETTHLSVTEIAYRVGFKEASYFSKCFFEEFGYRPSERRTEKNNNIN